MSPRALPFALLLAPLAAAAQVPGPAIPAYVPPPPVAVPPAPAVPMAGVPAGPGATPQAAVSDRFAQAYAARGKPRLAIFWNRKLGDAVGRWQAQTRLRVEKSGEGTISGDVNLSASSNSSTTITSETARPEPEPPPGLERTWEWEFQDGFLTPLLSAGATVMDRAAIIRMTGLESSADDIEAVALRGKADLLLQVQVESSEQSTVGFEMNVSVIEIASGQLLAVVNSRSMQGWARNRVAYVFDHRGITPVETDTVGPAGLQTWTAGPEGFAATTKPPTLQEVAEGLAVNVMDRLAKLWGGE